MSAPRLPSGGSACGRSLDARERAVDHLILRIPRARADPVDQHLQPVTGPSAREVIHVDRQIHEEGGPARQVVTAELAHRLAAADDGQSTLVEVAEGAPRA